MLGAVALVAAACGGESEPRAGDDATFSLDAPFFLEAEIVVEDVGEFGFQEETAVTLIRWWFQDAQHWRQELERVAPAIEANVITIVTTPEGTIIHDALDNTVSQQALPPVFPSFSILLGPAFGGDLDGFLQRFDGLEGAAITVAGRERVLGVEATIVELRTPAGRATDVARAPGSPESDDAAPEEIEFEDTVVRYWVDEERMFVLRTTIANSENLGFGELITLDFDPTFEAGLFELEVPAGVVELEESGSVSCRSSQTIGADGRVELPEPFLAPPGGPVGVGTDWGVSASSGTDCGVDSVELFSGTRGERFLQVAQRIRSDGIPEALRQGDPIMIRDEVGYEFVEGETRRLVWSVGEVVLVVSGEGVSREVLLALAESLE